MSLAEQVVVLAGTWVQSRKRVGRGEVIECQLPPRLSNESVVAEIGHIEPFDISIERDFEGKEKRMKAIRIGADVICWEPY